MEKVVKTFEEFHGINEAKKFDKMSTEDEATLGSVGFEEYEDNKWHYDTLYVQKKNGKYFVKDEGEKKDKGEWFDNLSDLLVARKFDESVINEKSSKDNALLDKMFKALKRSKNFSSIKMKKPDYPDDWDGAVIYIKSKLKSENDYHKNDFDEFEIGVDPDGGILRHYIPNGDTEPSDSVADILMQTRANEKVTEGKTNEKSRDESDDAIEIMKYADNDMWENLLGWAVTFYKDAADELTNMDAKGISKDLQSALMKIRKRTGN